MTLELARKRREQGDLIDELAAALDELLTSLHPNPHAMDLAMVEDDWAAIGGRTTWGVLRRARALIAKAKEHDCIPWDDVK